MIVTFKRKGRGVRAEPTLTTSGGDFMPAGTLFTIAGHGIGKRGQQIINGRSVDTKRKAKCVTLTLFKVTGQA
jgi:hypothetical protein